MGGIPGRHLGAERRHLGRLTVCLFNSCCVPAAAPLANRYRNGLPRLGGGDFGSSVLALLRFSLRGEDRRIKARVPTSCPLPNQVLRTDYRLRSIAAGDRARCSLKGEGTKGDGWGASELRQLALFFRLLASRSVPMPSRRFALATRQWHAARGVRGRWTIQGNSVSSSLISQGIAAWRWHFRHADVKFRAGVEELRNGPRPYTVDSARTTFLLEEARPCLAIGGCGAVCARCELNRLNLERCWLLTLS